MPDLEDINRLLDEVAHNPSVAKTTAAETATAKSIPKLRRGDREELIERLTQEAIKNNTGRLDQLREGFKYLGEIGERQPFTGVVHGIVEYMRKPTPEHEEEELRYITFVRTDDGGMVKYWNRLNYRDDDEEKTARFAGKGVRVSFAAKVIQHEEYRGERQTVVERATKVKILP